MCDKSSGHKGSDCCHSPVDVETCCCIEKSGEKPDVEHLKECVSALRTKAQKIEDFINSLDS